MTTLSVKWLVLVADRFSNEYSTTPNFWFSYVVFLSDGVCDMIRDAIAVAKRKYLMDATLQGTVLKNLLVNNK